LTLAQLYGRLRLVSSRELLLWQGAARLLLQAHQHGGRLVIG
jgi:hypothetical protein